MVLFNDLANNLLTDYAMEKILNKKILEDTQ